MISIHELLEDKTYKEFFLNQPRMPRVYRDQGMKPWRLYVQLDQDGKWLKKDAPTYFEAFKLFKKYRPDAHDATIMSRSIAFPPPHRHVRIKGKFQVNSRGQKSQVTKLIVWRPRLDGSEIPHRWCCYCRRPTIFRWFSKHHAFGKDMPFDPSALRCTICGVREDGMPRLVGMR